MTLLLHDDLKRGRVAYRGTSLTRKRTPLGPYRRPMSRVQGGSYGGGRFLMGEVPLYGIGRRPTSEKTRPPLIESQSQNVALTVLDVPYSLDSGPPLAFVGCSVRARPCIGRREPSGISEVPIQRLRTLRTKQPKPKPTTASEHSVELIPVEPATFANFVVSSANFSAHRSIWPCRPWNTVELIPTLGALIPRGGPVQDPVLTIGALCAQTTTRHGRAGLGVQNGPGFRV